MFPRKNESYNNGNHGLELQNRNQQQGQQQQSREFIRGGQDYDRFQSSNNGMPLFRPPPLPPPPRQQHSIVPPPPLHGHSSSLVGRYDNNNIHNRGWTVPDSTLQQSYNQTVFPPVPSNNFPNTSLPPPPLSMYPTTDTTMLPPAPPQVKASAIPYSAGPPMFVNPNTACPPPPLPNAACPPLPPPPPPVLSSQTQSDLNTTNSRNQITSSSMQSNMHVPQQPPPTTPIIDTRLNVGRSTSIPSPQDMLIVPPPNFNIPPPFLPTLNNNNNNNSMTIQQQIFENVKVYEKDKNEMVDIQRQKDQSWINQRFLKSNYYRTPQSTTTTNKSKKESITISEAQGLIRDMLTLAAQIQQQTKNLESIMATASKDDWMNEVKKIESMKEQLEWFRHKVNNEEVLAELQMKVKKRQKKRERLKRLRSRCYEEKQEAVVRRNEVHRRINEWRDAISQKEIQHKKDKEMKICVDSVLSEVRKKKSDVSKMLELIKTLSKLRKIRKDNVAKKGLYTLFHCDQKFEEDISRLQRILNHQMEIYEAEQRTLMVMLECEQEETKVRERARSNKVQAEIDKRERRREQLLLFGKRTIEEDDLLYPFMKFYSQAEDNWEAFIHIRREWDNYLVQENTPGANRLPNSWVMPPEPSDTLWAKLLDS